MNISSRLKWIWLYLIFSIILLVVLYLLTAPQARNYSEHIWGITKNLAIYFILLLLWLAFFSQFALPVHTFPDRQKLFFRLIRFLLGIHRPAIFIRNGEPDKMDGEERKKGAGILWLDTASAAVIRTETEIKDVLGPGVHFIEDGEFIAGTIDLHIQVQSLGLKDEDDPFAEKTEKQDEVKYHQIQERRKMISALTRDGIEIIPNISIAFRVNTGIPKGNEPGSRFGFRTGITRKAKANENNDKETIKKAILGQGIKIDLNASNGALGKRLAWNELPLFLAVDIWREYASKFTLNELFSRTQIIPPPAEKLPQPIDNEVDALNQPVLINASSNNIIYSTALAILKNINLLLLRATHLFEEKTEETTSQQANNTSPTINSVAVNKKGQNATALQVISGMIRARLTQPEVDDLDSTGNRGIGKVISEEYGLLEKRGIKVLSVSVNSLRVHPKVEEQLIKQWKADWLVNAKAESEQIDRKRNIIEELAREQAIIKYAKVISREVNEIAKTTKPEIHNILKSLLIRIRALIRSGEYSEQLRRRMNLELQEIEEIIKWLEESK